MKPKLFLKHLSCVFLPLMAQNALYGLKSASYRTFLAWRNDDIGPKTAFVFSALFGLLLAIAGCSLYSINYI